MKVIVYVEGPSDKLSMEQLFELLLVRAETKGVTISFIPVEGKRNLIVKTPTKAFNILRNDASAIVVALPDLYPKNVGATHETYIQLRDALQQEFGRLAKQRGIEDERVVEDLFSQHHDGYTDTVDAPLILGATQYSVIAERCPQCFQPFVVFLESVVPPEAA